MASEGESAPVKKTADGAAEGLPELLKPNKSVTNGLALPPDEQLQSMEIILTKAIEGEKVKKWYKKCWSERLPAPHGGTLSFLKPWLEGLGMTEVDVGEWEAAPEEETVINPWDEEPYQQKREVKYQYELTPGQHSSKVYVSETQFCKLTTNDRCVVAIKTAMEGAVSYCNRFTLQTRWVATRRGAKDISIRVGFSVIFSDEKPTSFSKIKKEWTTKKTQQAVLLFRRMKKVLSGEILLSTPVPENVMAKFMMDVNSKKNSILAAAKLILGITPPLLTDGGSTTKSSGIGQQEEQDDEKLWVMEFKEIRSKLLMVETMHVLNVPDERDDYMGFVRKEFKAAHKALDNILARYGKLSEAHSTILEAAFDDRFDEEV